MKFQIHSGMLVSNKFTYILNDISLINNKCILLLCQSGCQTQLQDDVYFEDDSKYASDESDESTDDIYIPGKTKTYAHIHFLFTALHQYLYMHARIFL